MASFLKITVYLTFPYVILYKISLVYLPEMSVRSTYQAIHVRQEIPRVAHLCILNLCPYCSVGWEVLFDENCNLNTLVIQENEYEFGQVL